MGVQPVGISRDSPWTHIAWTQAIDLNFGLLSDWNADAVHAFGIGFEHRGLKDVAQRRTYLVDAEGVIRRAWEYATSEVPDVEEWVVAARELQSSG